MNFIIQLASKRDQTDTLIQNKLVIFLKIIIFRVTFNLQEHDHVQLYVIFD